ncbi:SusC/RagA family TonB-linked outer membrane protein [Mucilaginibacter sp. ZT4R22]|uniref:SusC/RagA family TonB-linked outer membrane protein n=2 Tax=Mucilaginibacter pankratovii TaxID=2772110 RepID=A0ABR7WWD2_9SPHI|nr:SusC/RagA family TonB-linked outer membrane protein [Mucilaginibacter pankratovii]
MRLTTLILIVTMMQVSAGTLAQKISLSEKNVSLDKIFKKISQQSGYDFLIKGSTLTGIKPVTINLKNVELTDVLNIICKDQPIQYKIENKRIVISQVSESFIDQVKSFFSEVTINGSVVDESGAPMPGTTVKVKEKDIVVVTDKAGKFTITVPNEKSLLVFSFIGFVTQEVPAKTGMLVTMKPGSNKLEETVIVGYGSTKRRDLTGSVASVNMDEVKDVPFATFDQALTGKASGVQVVQSDGSPGGVAKIRIRGGTSLLGGNDPLYIIDGVQVQVQNNYLTSAADVVSPVERGGSDNPNNSVSGAFARALNSLGGLNINDIASIDILKDASATAIYGSKAANGVVIITTKKGRYNQKSTLEANYYTSVSVARKEKLLNRDQYMMILKEGATNLNAARALKGQVPDGAATSILTDPNFFENGNTDWMNLVLRKGITQNADVSLRGGGEGSRYYTSLSYNKNEGAVLGTDFTKIAGKISLDNDITKKFRISTNLDYAFLGNNVTNGVYTQAMYAPPTMNPYNADGSIKVISSASLGAFAYQGFQNPLFLLSGKNETSTVSLIGSVTAEYDILKELKFRSSVAVNYNTYNQNNYVPSTVSIATPNGSGSSNNGTATQGQSQNVNVFYENTITWDKQFNKDNHLTLLAGTSWQINKSKAFTASGQGFPDDTYLNNLSSAAVTLPSTGVSGQNSLLSFYGRANYSLFDKYLFTFTGRSDASSKFPAYNRVGYFPSGGVAWRISQEKFLKNVTWIDDIKLRASIGYTGTQNIADNLFYTLYSPVSYAGINGLSPSQLGNSDLKWESTLQKDAGIDIELFKSRLRLGVGYYNKVTSGVLFPTTVANSSGASTVTANIATIQNRGLEFELSGDFIKKEDFQWSGSLNVSGNRSKVLALPVNIGNPTDPSMYIYGNTVLQVGQPLGLLYGKVFDGIIQNQQELDAYKKASYYGAYALPYTGIGDARFKGDGIPVAAGFTQSLYANDVIGHAEPRFYGGYNNTLTYKAFTLATLATFSQGGDIYYLADIQNMDLSTRTNKGVRILDRWTPENPSTTRPRLLLGQSSFANASSANVYKASYLKIKSVTLSYQLPKSILNKLKISKAYLYASATNLFTFTKYPGADPEVSNDPYSLIGGYSDSGGYPTVKQYSFGLRIGF